MSDIINLLPEKVANQIAAGEVVQRPASVVKELLENAIDAKATEINLIVKDAGRTLVQVIDNGKGMSETDARMCFERHATSKITSTEDIFNIQTKGFRGEALASIAAVAQVELKTKREDDELTTHLKIEGGKFIEQSLIAGVSGTQFIVKNLFYNVPARRNFLKSNNVEFRHIQDEFHRVALAHSQIHFTLIHDTKEIFNLPKASLRQRIVNVFGKHSNKKWVPIQEETEIVKIHGFIGKPEFAKKSRGEQFFFANDRFIKNHQLHYAILNTYKDLILTGSHPSYFIFFEINPQKIDINIHPTKTEIKFEDEHTIIAILRSAIKHALGSFSVIPSMDFEENPIKDIKINHTNIPKIPQISVDSDFNPFQQSNQYYKKNTGLKSTRNEWANFMSALQSDTDEKDNPSYNDLNLETTPTNSTEIDYGETIQTSKPIFQWEKKYIITSLGEKLLIVDQYRAHQRILFDGYYKDLHQQSTLSQQLLFTVDLDFNPTELNLLTDIKSDLLSTGFDFSIFDQKLSVSAVPAEFKQQNISQFFDEILENLQSDADIDLKESIAKSLASSNCIRGGQNLSEEECKHIIEVLIASTNPNYTPSGKKIMVDITFEEIIHKLK